MAKLVPYVIVLILAVLARITVSDDSTSSYYSWNYEGVSSNDVDASSRGYESPALEENQYDTPPSPEGDVASTNTYYESRYAYPPNAGADNSSTADDVTYASPPDMSSAPSSLGTMANNSDETYKDELSPSSSYDDSSTPQSDSSSSSSYYDSSTPKSDSSLSSSYYDPSTPQSDSSSFSSYYDPSTPKSDSSSSSSYYDPSTPQSDSSSSSSYYDPSTPQSDSSSSSSYDGSSTPQSDSSSSSSYDDSSSSSSSDDSSSSSSSTREEDSSPTTTDESQSGTEGRYNSVEELGSGVDVTEMKTEHSGSKAGLVFGVLIGVCAVGSVGFIYIKKKRESYPNTNSYISLTRWDRI